SYILAQHVTQFPLPIMVGIGHDRDETVLDYVANTRVKTPTAAAEWLIGQMSREEAFCIEIQNTITTTVNEYITRENERLTLLSERIPAAVTQRLAKEENRLLRTKNNISYCIQQGINRERLHLGAISSAMRNAAERAMERERGRLQLISSKIELTSPEYILRRGYSITVKGGYPVKSAAEIKAGDNINIVFADGEADAVIDNVKNNN
ncbi:MAG: exodeoxyribonuclease VII large subunit, partial [Bacteroidales bacterium]